jgi:D-alanine-D-alanine ligase
MVKLHSSLKIKKEAKIGVLCGGMSSEREVSLRSGKNCQASLLRLGYKNAELIDVKKDIANFLLEKTIEIAFIALHGKYGEDGCIQGLLEILEIPYTGCGVKASSIGMDKEFTKIIAGARGIPIIPSVLIDDYKLEGLDLKFPLMVKPVCEGSSIGISKVNTNEELDIAVQIAQKYKCGVMFEEFKKGKSITVGVLDIDENTIATPILELRTKTEWYDYQAKYTKGLTEFILPADIDEILTKQIQDYAVRAHKAIDGRGMSRVDFIVAEEVPYMLEINTIPGMTDLSDLPAQAGAMGIDYDGLVEIILTSVQYRNYFDREFLCSNIENTISINTRN